MAARSRHLFERYPGTRAVPWLQLAELPTPVERLRGLEGIAGAASLWVKRDDLTSTVYGGNKVRKLEFLLGQAISEGATDVITFGAAGSNHALATAIHGRAANLAVHSMLMPQVNASYVRRNLLASLGAGADLHFSADQRSVLADAAQLRHTLRAVDGARVSVIPFGGTSAASTLGFVNAGLELAAQVTDGALPEPDLVYVPLGSMGTAAGLAIGLRAAGLNTRVVAVPVLTEDAGLEPSMLETVGETQRLLCALDATFPCFEWGTSDIELSRGHLGEGYASRTEGGAEAVELMRQSAGIGLETTYTGKTLAALLSHGRSGALADKNVLFWDTYNSRDVGSFVALADASRLPAELLDYLTGDPG